MTIDWWTLGFQTVNIAILVWLLGRFFWTPVAAMIEERRTAARTVSAEAEAKRNAATIALADIAQTRAGFATEREAILSAAHVAADAEHKSRLADAAKDVASLEASAKSAIAKGQAAAEKAWAQQASHLAVDIAGRLAGRLNGPVVQAGFLDWLLTTVRDLPEATRKAAGDSGQPLEVTSPAVLDPADQDRYRGKISDAFGGHPLITFATDPALIAGVELHGAHLAISNSWRADLNRIREDMARDHR